MKLRKWLAGFFAVVLSVTMAFAIAACQPEQEQQTEKTEGPETGVYYYDTGADEYTIALNNADQFTFLVMGENKTGTYTLTGESLVLDFAKAEDGELTATLVNDVLTVTYENSSMRFLKKIDYTVTYDTQGGGAVNQMTVVNGKTVSKPEDPVFEGYKFIGWYTDTSYMTPFMFDAQPVTGDLTLYAYWLAETPSTSEYTVDFDLGYDAQAPAAVQTVEGCVIASDLPAPTREGYTFLGWYVSAYDSADQLTYQYAAGMPLKENTTLYALWQDDAAEGLALPEVSVTSSGVAWDAVEGARVYTVTITGPDGLRYTQNDLETTSLEYDFSDAAAGDYIVTVTASANTTTTDDASAVTATRYYKNKALASVSSFTVIDPSTLMFEGVEGAQRYYLTVDCGDDNHSHDMVALGSSTYYNFINCPMQEGGIRFTVTAEGDGYASSVSKTFVYIRELAQVSGLRYDAATETISWDSVADAMGYVVAVNGTSEDVGNATSYCIKDIAAGEVTFSVYPRTTGYNSPVASTLTVTKQSLATPQNIRVSGNTLTWNAVAGATGYMVSVNGEEYSASSNTFDLSGYVLGGELVVSVQAKGTADSLWSNAQTLSYLAMSGSLVYADSRLTWNSVIGATYYEVQVNDGAIVRYEIGTTSAAVVLTRAGYNTLKVRFGGEDGLPSAWTETEVFAYEIAFDTRGGTAVNSLFLAQGDPIELPQPSSDAYNFVGWYNVPGGAANNGALFTETVFEERSDILLYAYWTGKTFTITYHADHGATQSTTESVVYGEQFAFEVPAITAERDARYAFVGWYTGASGEGTKLTGEDGKGLSGWQVAEDITVYAYWAEALSFVETVGSAGEAAYTVQAGPEIGLVNSITIPAVYQGKQVTDILSGAFRDCTTLVNVNIPDSIRTVGALSLDDSAGAFSGCTNLMNVNVYQVEGTHEVYYSSVDGVLLLDSPQTNTVRIAYFPAARSGIYYVPDVVEEIPTRTFANSDITAVVIPESVLYIRQTAFYNCDDLEIVSFTSGSADAQTLLIEGYAFQSCDALEEITLPARLGEVESFNDVFYACNALENVYFEEGNALYSSVDGLICDALGTTAIFCPYGKSGVYTIPGEILAIGEGAFESRDQITDIVIGAYVATIGAHAFEDCANLESVTFRGSAAANATEIGSYAFYNCAQLTTVTFEENCAVSAFGDYAFAYCEKLAEILIPTTTETIGAYAFQSCVLLQSITIEGGEKELTIGDYAFSECGSLTEVNLMSAVADFNFYRVFNGCNYIENVNVDESNSNFADIDGILYSKDLTAIVYYPRVRTAQTYELPESVMVIREGAFADNPNLESFVIGENVTTIEAYAFYNCSAIQSITIDGGTAELTLGDYAFAGCSGFSTLSLPDRTKTIGNYTFYATSSLTDLSFGTDDLSKAILTGIGSYAFAQIGVEEIVIPDTVSEIGANAFDSCQSLVRVELPSSMKIIGTALFSNCPALSEVDIPEGVEEIADEAFVDSSALSVITLPSTLKIIGEAAFENTGIVNLTIPASVTSIKDDAFLDCIKLESLVFEDGTSALTVGKYVFDGCIALQSAVISSNVSSLGDYAFSNCTSLVSITFNTDSNGKSMLTTIGQRTFLNCGFSDLVLPEGLTTITSNAFYGGTDAGRKLETIVLPSTLTSIGASAFYYQSNLTSVTFKDGTEDLTIANSVFMNCSELESIHFPANLVSVDTRTIQGCTSLSSITVSENNANYISVDGVLYAKDAQTGGVSDLALFPIGKTGSFELPEGMVTVNDYLFQKSQLTSIVLPDTVTSIGDYAFQNSTIESVTLSSKLESIGNYAFQNVPLTSVTLPSTLTTIGNYAFGGTSLTEITLPKGITTMGTYVFQNCTSLKTVTFEEGFNPTTYTNVTSRASESTPVKGNYSFANSGVTTINLAASMTQIPMAMFFQCADLTTINFAENGKLATIGAYAFGAATTSTAYPKITSIEIPASVTEIEAGAFNNWQNLTTVTFEEGDQPLVFGDGSGYSNFAVKLNYTNHGVFGYCTSLVSITLPYRLTTLGRFTFTGCSALKNVNFEQNEDGEYGIQEIDYGAFRETAIESFVVPDSVTSLPYNSTYTNNTFARCLSLKSVTLPATFTSANGNTFSWRMFLACESLEAVNIAEGNPDYYSVDGVVFDKNDQLIYYPAGKASGETYTIPEGTSAIVEQSFYHYSVASSSSRYGYNDYATISGVVIPASVTTIEESAFELETLTSVTFADATAGAENANELTIGASAFSASALTSVVLPARLTSIGTSAFNGCAELTSVTFSDDISLTSIGNQAFSGCAKLTSVRIPASVETIGYGAFYGCEALSSVVFESGSNLQSFGNSTSGSSTAYKNGVFSGCTLLSEISLPESLTSIPNYAFYGCTNLSSVEFGNNSKVESIGNYAFSGCTNLDFISLPINTASIGNSAFADCTALAEVEMLPTLVSIGTSAFSGCSALETFTVYGALTSIGESAFAGCTKLDLNVDENNTSYMVGDSSGILYDSTQKTIVSLYGNLTGEVVIPDTVTSIPDGMFAGSAVTKVTLPASITEITDNMFKGCTDLTEVVILGRITSIGEYAFADSGLQKITIGRYVTSIGNYAFQNCADLTEVTFEANGSSILSIGNYAFQNCDGLTGIDLPVRLRNPNSTSYIAGLGNYAFDGCTSLQTVTFNVRGGEMLTEYLSLGNYAFSNTALTSFTMPSYSGYRSSSMAAIGYYCFENSALQSFTFNSTRQNYYYISSYAFRNCTSLKEINNIPANLYLSSTTGVFQGCTALKEITLPAFFPSGVRCFSGCTSLETVTFYGTSNVVAQIGSYMFENCTALTTVNLPNTIYTIGQYAFIGCTALESIDIPVSVQYINDGAFAGCSSLTSINLEEGNLRYQIIDGNIYSADGKTLVQVLAKTDGTFMVPSSVTTIMAGAFVGCTNLTEVVIPESVTVIEADAFMDWTAAQTISVACTSEEVPQGWEEGWSGGATVVYAPSAPATGEEGGSSEGEPVTE